MRDLDKKQLILKALKEAESLGLPELIEKLGPSFAERSLRRWLNELGEEGLVEKSGQKRATRYFLAETSSDSVFKPSSQKTIEQIKKPLFHRNPVAYSKKWLDNYEPNKTFYLSQTQRENLQKQGQRKNTKDPAGTYARKIYNRLLIDLSYNSSRLEGNTYSLIDTQKLLLEGIGNEKKLDEEKVMILNHKEAIRHLVDSINKIKIDFNEICTLHYLLSDGLVANQYAGKVRDYGVRISASTYIPLENPKQLEKQLNEICIKANKIKSPYEQSFFLLTHIAYLQAFVDVNKRTARLSANISLIKNNLVPLSFNEVDKDDYISAMIAIYELNNPRPLADIYFASYFRTCKEYDATLESIVFDEFRVRYRDQRRALIRHIILNKLVGNNLDTYIKTETKKQIPEEDCQKFEEDLREDLNEIGPQRIAGLGVSQKQLEEWIAALRSR